MKRKLALPLFLAAAGLSLIRWNQPAEPSTPIVPASIAPPAPEPDLSAVVQDGSEIERTSTEKTIGAETSSAEITPPASKPVLLPDPTAEHEAFLTRFDPKLTDDPDVDELIRNRLWLALDQFNNPMIKSLELTPAEMDKFKSLVVDNLVSAANHADGAIERGAREVEAAMNQALADSRSNLDAKIAEVLGETRFAIYETYKGDYGQFNRIKFLKGSEPLSDPQTEQVLDVMLDEKQIVSSAAAQVQAADALNQESVATEQQAQQNAEIQKLINERVYDRLKNILSEDRLASFIELRAQPSQSALNPGMAKNQ